MPMLGVYSMKVQKHVAHCGY